MEVNVVVRRLKLVSRPPLNLTSVCQPALRPNNGKHLRRRPFSNNGEFAFSLRVTDGLPLRVCQKTLGSCKTNELQLALCASFNRSGVAASLTSAPTFGESRGD